MKKIISYIMTSALLLTGCGHIPDNNNDNNDKTESQTVSAMYIQETGGEDGRNNTWTISHINGNNVLSKTDRMNNTFTYNISDEDFQDILTTDFSGYIGCKENLENVCDGIYYRIEINYDDGSQALSEVYIQELWDKLKKVNISYEPLESEIPEPAGSTDDIGQAYFKEPSEEDIVFNEEHNVRYVKNQLLISASPETPKDDIEKLAEETDGEIVGYIELTGDYQIEFGTDKTIDELQNVADYMDSYPFVLNVTLNLVDDVCIEEE